MAAFSPYSASHNFSHTDRKILITWVHLTNIGFTLECCQALVCGHTGPMRDTLSPLSPAQPNSLRSGLAKGPNKGQNMNIFAFSGICGQCVFWKYFNATREAGRRVVVHRRVEQRPRGNTRRAFGLLCCSQRYEGHITPEFDAFFIKNASF